MANNNAASSDSLLRSLLAIFDHYLADQQSEFPRHDVSALPAEIHGNLYDLLRELEDIDKAAAEALIYFIIGLLYADEVESGQDILFILSRIRASLNKMIAT